MPFRLPDTTFLSRPRNRYFLVALVIFILGLTVWRFLFAGANQKVNVTTVAVERGSIENLVTATGILQPRDYVDVGAQVSGQLKNLLVDVGSEVKAGDLLAEIDATVYAANVDSTRAQLISQQAQLRDRDAQVKLAEINYQRQQNLQKADATTQEALESAEATLTSVRAQLDVLKAQIKQTESNLRAQEANLDFANIYAPMDGTVVSISSRQGQTLNTNQMAPTIMRIADLSVMTVQTQVSEADIGKLRLGMPVYFTTLGSQGRRWYSTLDRIQPTPEVLNNVVLYNALFEVPNEQRVLMTQMSTQVFFISGQAKDVLLVPMSALTFERPARVRDDSATKNIQSNPARTREDIAAASTGSARTDSTTEKRATENTERNNNAENIASEKSGARRLRVNAENTTAQNPVREASVQVMKSNGKQEVRTVTVGVTNRIQAEIISGLNEGEVVITGTRQAGTLAATQGGQRGLGPRMLR